MTRKKTDRRLDDLIDGIRQSNLGLFIEEITRHNSAFSSFEVKSGSDSKIRAWFDESKEKDKNTLIIAYPSSIENYKGIIAQFEDIIREAKNIFMFLPRSLGNPSHLSLLKGARELIAKNYETAIDLVYPLDYHNIVATTVMDRRLAGEIILHHTSALNQENLRGRISNKIVSSCINKTGLIYLS